MYNWGTELYRECKRYDREYSREYKTDSGLWRNQSYGSLECQYVKENALQNAIDEYKRSNEWN